MVAIVVLAGPLSSAASTCRAVIGSPASHSGAGASATSLPCGRPPSRRLSDIPLPFSGILDRCASRTRPTAST